MTNEHVDRFNAVAREYTTDRYPVRSHCMRKVLDLLEPKNEDILLDVGCGPGSQLIDLSVSIKFGYGIDPAQKMVSRAERSATRLPNIKFYVGSAEALPRQIKNVGINKIFSNYALHHLPDTEKRNSIECLSSILPENGLIIIGDLMFSDDPDKHKDLFDVVGYGPGCDTPSQLSFLEDSFVKAGLSFCTHRLNPLVAVIAGRKTNNTEQVPEQHYTSERISK